MTQFWVDTFVRIGFFIVLAFVVVTILFIVDGVALLVVVGVGNIVLLVVVDAPALIVILSLKNSNVFDNC